MKNCVGQDFGYWMDCVAVRPVNIMTGSATRGKKEVLLRRQKKEFGI